MKKLVLSAFVLVCLSAMTSCKKSYSCECVTTYTDGNGSEVTLTQVKAMDEKMKDAQASASCKETEAQMNYVNDDLNADPNGTYADISSACSVK